MNLLNTKIQTIEGVSRTETFISLDQQIDRQFKEQQLQYIIKLLKSHLIHKRDGFIHTKEIIKLTHFLIA
jgi:hypothetical protein